MQKFRFSLTSLLGSVFVAAIGCAALARPTEAWATAVVSMSVGVLFVALVRLIYVESSRRAFWVGFAICGWGYLLMVRVVMPFHGGDADLLVTSRLLESLARATLGDDPSTPSPFYAGPGYAPPASYTSVPTTAGGYGAYPEDMVVEAPIDVPVPAAGAAPLPEDTEAPSTTSFEPVDIEQPPTSLAPPPPAAYPVFTVVTSVADPGAWQHLMQIGHYLWALVLGFAGGLLGSFFQVRASRRESKGEAGDKPAVAHGGDLGGERMAQ